MRAVNGLLEKVNAQGHASLVKSGARLEEGDVLTLLSGEAYIQFIHGFPEALALGKPVKLDGVSPALQYGVEELNEQLVQEALAKGIDPSVILDVLGSAAAGAEAVGSGGDAFIIDPLFGFGQVTAGYPTGPISFAYEADTQHLFWYVPEETVEVAESDLTTEPESIPQIPQFTTNQAVLTVFEDALPSGIADSAGQARIASSSLSSLLTSSPDVAASFAFNSNSSALPTLKSGGIDLSYELSADKRTLTLRESSTQGPGAEVMKFELTADGRLTQTLMDSIDHPTTDSDDGEWMRLDLSPLIDVTFTRASDGTVLESRTLPANAVVAGIQDDVPIARAQLTNNEILLDETIGMKAGDADAANDDFNPATTVDPFNNTYGIPIGLVQNANLLDTSTSEMGGDYKNATMTHLLKITDAVSGLQTTDGTPINLFLESNGDITGRAGDVGAPAVFAIRMNPNTGAISVAQYGPIKQFDTNSHDEAVDLTGRISAVVTAKDSDGDESNVEIPIGQLIVFEDDGPSIVVSGATQTLTVDESVLATNDTQSFAGLFTPSFGADGAAAANALTYSLGVSANGAASGVLDTASGNQVFNISVDGSGNVTLDQVRAVVHDNPLDPDESTGPTQLNAANLVTLTAVATDKDGDSASATANIGLSFNFEDDGPSIVVSGATQTLTVDESVLATNDTQSFAGLFTPSFGADGAAAANALTYSLGVSANGAASGVLDTASGNQVFLFLENGIVVGREGSDALDAATGDVVFNISVDGSGNVTLDQVRAVVHDNPLDPDESTGPTQLNAANLVTLTAVATDKDGDSASATANIGLSFNFEDDGPVASTNKLTGVVDEDGLTGGIAGGVGDVAGQAVAASGNVATLFQSGADAPLTYSLNASTSGLPALSSGGVALTYAVSGDTLTASAGSTQVFTFTLNANGNYSFTLLAKLDHPAGADEND
ncbi:enhanced entry virulence factor RtxA, partial [Legionella pneumophila]|uniref:enhanced entry virulence factor RtxA n=1 Tax=Legionella pneumophila TaxID=446 RepID=UPI001E5B53AA